LQRASHPHDLVLSSADVSARMGFRLPHDNSLVKRIINEVAIYRTRTGYSKDDAQQRILQELSRSYCSCKWNTR
jgi:hypothetical protein